MPLRHASRAAKVAVLCSFAAAAAVGVVLVAERTLSDRTVRKATERHEAAEHIAHELLMLDERLTMTAKLAAATGDESTRRAYDGMVAPFYAAVDKAKALAGPAASKQFAADTDTPSERLFELETQAFALAGAGRSAEAQALLAGPEYQLNKRRLSAGTAKFLSRLGQQEARQLAQAQSRGWTLFALVGVLALFGFVGLWRVLSVYVARADAAQRRMEADLRQRELEQSREAAKTEAVGQLAGGIAHDFNNLLAVVIGNLDLLEAELPEGRGREELQTALAASERGAELTHQLLAFARKQPLMARELDLNGSVTSLAEELRAVAAGRTLTLELAEGASGIKVDPGQLGKALKGLVKNAAEATPPGGRIAVRTEAGRRPTPGPGGSQRYLCVSVTDTGCGVPAENLGRVFEPFFSTKPTGAGGGLGLSMVYGFIKQSGGEIEFESEEGVGTTVRLYFPTAAAVLDVPSFKADELGGAGTTKCILVVDDDAAVRKVVAAQLSGLGYKTLEAAHGAEALRVLAGAPHVQLVFTDVLMPGMNGLELGREVQARWPGLRVLYTSGFTGGFEAEGGELPADRFLAKPYRAQDLAQKVEQVLAAA